jgi:acyl carrier protein
MNQTDLQSTIRAFLLKNFYVADASSLKDETSLLEAGIIDSTGVLEVVAFLEAELGVTVEDEEMIPQNLDSLAAMVAFVTRKKAAT